MVVLKDQYADGNEGIKSNESNILTCQASHKNTRRCNNGDNTLLDKKGRTGKLNVDFHYEVLCKPDLKKRSMTNLTFGDITSDSKHEIA
ncbi:MAG: hypothetical protein WA364_07475 [Candidatus Nitrosopolaris sp.]